MQKYALILSLLVIGQAFSKNESNKAVLVEQILLKSGVADFNVMVKQIKKNETVSPANAFVPKQEFSSEQQAFWSDFPLADYVDGLKKQMERLFALKELETIKTFYTNPFHAKILARFNSDASFVGFWEKLPELELDQTRLSKNKITLIQSLVNLHKINPLIEDQKKQLRSEVERQKKVLEILKLADETIVRIEKERNEKYLKQFDLLAIKFLGKSFASYRASELREMTRVMRAKEVQDYAQLATNYHYHFLENYKKNRRHRMKTQEGLQKGKELTR